MKELKRVLLKLSGEALAENGSYNEAEIKRIAEQVKELYDKFHRNARYVDELYLCI